MQFISRVLTALAIESLMTTTVVQPTDVSPTITVGTQEAGLSAGYILPHRFMADHTTKQQGPAIMPSWMMTLTDPIGDSWYRGQVSLGAEMVYIQFQGSFATRGVGFAPKIKYTFPL